MGRFEDLAKHLDKVKESKRGILLSLLKDFVYYEGKVEEYKGLPQVIYDKKDPTRQKKLPASNVLHQFQASKNDVAVKILRSLDNEDSETSELAKKLAEFTK